MTTNPPLRQDFSVTGSEKDHPETSTNQATENALTGVTVTPIPGVQDRSELSQGAPSGSVHIRLLNGLDVCLGIDGHAYILVKDHGNAHALRIGSRQTNRYLLRKAHQLGYQLVKSDISHINEELATRAELSDQTCQAWHRVAPIEDGVELDMGDSEQTRIRVTPGKVEIIHQGSKTLFHRTPGMLPFVMPAELGDLTLLDKYVNLDPDGLALYKGWLSYTLYHPKASTTNYVILVLQGCQGSGKSTLFRHTQALLDPCQVSLQTFPSDKKDLLIAAQHAHVLFFDNMRSISPSMADMLSIASTGGSTTTRRLYTDDEQHVHNLHVAMGFNGIHSIIDQSDLAQRCLPLFLNPLNEDHRRSEAEFVGEFQADLPKISRGLLDLVAAILVQLPDVKVSSPERMIEFTRWLAAMEMVDGMAPGLYQKSYSRALNGAMLDSMLDNSLAAAVITFMNDSDRPEWCGTPSELLSELNLLPDRRSARMDWPQNPIALSKRLRPLQAGLRRQGINVQISRGHVRKITITRSVGS